MHEEPSGPNCNVLLLPYVKFNSFTFCRHVWVYEVLLPSRLYLSWFEKLLYRSYRFLTDKLSARVAIQKLALSLALTWGQPSLRRLQTLETYLRYRAALHSERIERQWPFKRLCKKSSIISTHSRRGNLQYEHLYITRSSRLILIWKQVTQAI